MIFTGAERAPRGGQKHMLQFMIGFATGVCAAILLAPDSGRATRARLAAAASGGVNYMKRQTGELRESALDIVEQGKNVVNRQVERMSGVTPVSLEERYQR